MLAELSGGDELLVIPVFVLVRVVAVLVVEFVHAPVGLRTDNSVPVVIVRLETAADFLGLRGRERRADSSAGARAVLLRICRRGALLGGVVGAVRGLVAAVVVIDDATRGAAVTVGAVAGKFRLHDVLLELTPAVACTSLVDVALSGVVHVEGSAKRAHTVLVDVITLLPLQADELDATGLPTLVKVVRTGVFLTSLAGLSIAVLLFKVAPASVSSLPLLKGVASLEHAHHPLRDKSLP